MKTHIVIFLSVIVLVCMLSACQPTPEEETVIQKDNFEELVNKTAEPINSNEEVVTNNESTSENDSDKIFWEESQNKVTIKVDCTVPELPSNIPVLSVERDRYDEDFVSNTVSYFLGDEYYQGGYIKSDWLIKMLPMKFAIQKMNIADDDNYANAILSTYKRFYEMAPEDNKPGSLDFVDVGIGDCVIIKGYPDEGIVAELQIGNGTEEVPEYSDSTFEGIYYVEESGQRQYVEIPEQYLGIPARKMNTSYEDAKQIAEDAIKSIYGEEMSCVQSSYVNVRVVDENYLNYESMKDQVPQCYVFYYTPIYKGVPQLYAPEARNFDDMFVEGSDDNEDSESWAYRMRWTAEYVKVYVDDTGIVMFWAFSPTKTTEVINSNVEISSFDNIFNRFKKDIFYTSAWSSGAEYINISINEIRFGMVRTEMKDNPDQYYMVPAWQFIGSLESSSNGGDAEYYESGRTFMVLNAIDGSIIDTSYYIDNQLSYSKTIGMDKFEW